MELPGRKGHHDLKKLYQEVGIPPWERAGIPLVYLDDKLAAVGEYWISAEFYSDNKEPCLRITRHKINPKGNDDAANVD
jgi:tRNA(Ile)-lysidine synthase